MEKIILLVAMLAMVGTVATARESYDGLTLSRPFTSGKFFQGMSHVIPTGCVVLPYGLDITFDKTVYLIFPSAIRYVDLGSQNIIAGKTEDAEDILRVKVPVRDFEAKTNTSIICKDGSFYVFNVRHVDEPEKLSIRTKDFLSTTESRLLDNRPDIYFKELGNESPVLVKLMMQAIYQNDRCHIKRIGTQQSGIKFLLRGLYVHNGLLYFHTRMENDINMPYSVDFVAFEVIDKKMAGRTTIQEQVLQPLRAYYQVMRVRGVGIEHIVFILGQFSLAKGKQPEVTLYEKNSGRMLTFYITAEDLQLAKKIGNLELKW